MCLTTVFVLSVISTLVINWRIQFRDLLILVGIQPFFFFLDNTSDISDVSSANDRKQGQSVISQDVCRGYVFIIGSGY